MERSILRDLYQLGLRQQRETAHARNLYENLANWAYGPELLRLARRKLGVAIDARLLDCQIIDAFFTKPAADLMLTLPNQYWFWHVLADLVVAGAAAEADRFTLEDVQHAFAKRRADASVYFDLKKSFDELSDIEKLRRLAFGLVVFNTSGSPHHIVENPIYR